MSGIELRLLGDFGVLRDGKALALPPSRKTRALLAFLALHERSFRREYLCELLWEIPDDPRGSLRWSLSKLRRLVDGDKHKRIVADRTSVSMTCTDLRIDVNELFALAEHGLAKASTEDLEHAAQRFRGHFLEGLELSSFHDFHAWCVAERERTAQAQAAILKELCERLADEPERALPHARALVAVSPYDESARARLIRMLVSLRHADEAEQHFQLGLRMLKELGITSSGELLAARRRSPEPADPRPGPEVADEPVPPAPTVSTTSPSLFGREREMARLTGAWASARQDGRARFMLLSGEPGMGKSSLLDAMLELGRGEDACILEARAYASEHFRPFALWIDALRRLSPEAGEEIFGDRELDRRDHLLGRLSALVAREAAVRPVLLVFDDYQWCDESSAAALHYVARMNRDQAVFGVLAARSSELRDNAPALQSLRNLRADQLIEEMEIGPLPMKDLKALIAARDPDADGERLAMECGGNPLLAIELAHAGKSDGGSLDELVRQRLARFDTEGGEVLRWAAVLNPHIQLADLVEMSGLATEVIGAALERAVQQGMLMATGSGLHFSHELIAQGVYHSISPLRRQIMHRQIAQRLEARSVLDLEVAADLAHHASQSGDAALAARALVLAGRLCLRFFANEKAASHARRGLQLAARLPERDRVCVSIDLHDVLLAAEPLADWEPTAAEFVRLAEQALDHGALEHARLGYHLAATLRWEHGQWSGAQEQSMQAARVARSGNETHSIIGLAETAKCLALLERDLPQADALLMEAQALASRQRFRHQAIPIGLGLLRLHEDRLEEAEELFLEARTLCKSAGDHFSEFQAGENLTLIAWYRGDFQLAFERSEALRELASKLREGSEEPLARALYGLCRYHQSGDAQALDQALADLRIADAKYRLAYTLSRAAMLDLERDRLDAAVQRATEALAYAELLQRPSEMLVAHTVLYRASEMRGDRASMKAHAEVMRSLCQGGVVTWAREQARLALPPEVLEEP